MSDTTPVTEIVSFPLKEGSKPGEGQEKMFGVDAGDGFQGGYFGSQVENKTVFHWFLNWDSHAAHVKMIDTPHYKPFIGKILEWSSAPTFYHAALKPHPPTAVFSSPVTEVAKWTVAVSKEDWVGLYEGFGEALKLAPGYRAHAGGYTVENEDEFAVVIGWDSVEAHTAYVKSEAGAATIARLMASVSSPEMWHVRVDGTVTSDRK